jgi:phage terminase large subunit-like protein
METKEIDSVVKAYIGIGNLDEALRKAKLGASKETRIFVIRAYINAGQIAEVPDVMKVLNISIKEIDSLVDFYRDNGWIDIAVDTAKLGASNEKCDILIGDCIKRGWIIETLEMIEIRKRKLSTKEIDTLIKVCVNKGFTLDALKLVDLGASKQMVELLKQACIDEGYGQMGL